MSDEDFSTEAKTNMRARSHRRDNLLHLIGKNGGDIPKDHLLGVFMMRDHVSLSTTYEYLQELKMARLVVESNGHIISMELHLKEQEEDMDRLKELVKKPEQETKILEVEPEDDEIEAVREGRKEFAAGEYVTWESVRKRSAPQT